MTLDCDLTVLIVQMVAGLRETHCRLVGLGKYPEAIDAEIRDSIQRMAPAIRDHLQLEMTDEEVIRWMC